MKKDPKIEEILTRGVDQVIVEKDLTKNLYSGKKLRVKLGFDPTGPRLHIGRSVQFLKLRDFQRLGHQIVFIVGNATGLVGDASDKDEARVELDEEKLAKNMKTYEQQAGKILDMSKVEIHYNADWLMKLGFKDILFMAKRFTVAKLLERQNYFERYKNGKPIGLHEFLYPLLQGYDSVAVKADVEIGGADQIFNVLAGRVIQSAYGQKPQNIITSPLVNGLDGRKMSTSWGNVIAMLDEPNDMYGKVMSMRDEMIGEYFELITRVPMSEVNEVRTALASGANPRDYKARLAYEIVKMYHDRDAADKAADNFDKVFKSKQNPDEMEKVKLTGEEVDLVALIVENNLAPSKTVARRLIKQKAVKLDGQVVENTEIKIKKPSVLKVGKRKFLRLQNFTPQASR